MTLPLERPYRLSGGRLRFESLDSTVVGVETDDGIVGWGEGCPWGATYLPAFGGGVRAGLEQIAPQLLGCDPRRVDVINGVMDAALPGHPYVKSALDIACWDILGKAAGLALCELLGGRVDAAFIQVKTHHSSQLINTLAWNTGCCQHHQIKGLFFYLSGVHVFAPDNGSAVATLVYFGDSPPNELDAVL